MEAIENKALTNKDRNMPLVMLNPDSKGKTALDWALDKQRPKSFELMISLLGNFNHIPITKMMITTLPQMVKSNTEVIYKFFENCHYKNTDNEECLVVFWPNELKEFHFVSPTSFITQKSLTEALEM